MEICKKGQAVNYASLEIWHEIKKTVFGICFNLGQFFPSLFPLGLYSPR